MIRFRKHRIQCMKETELTSHILRRHPQGPQDSIFYPCDKCEFQSMTKNVLKVHTQSKHSRSRVWSNRCTDCGYAAKSQKLLSRHVAIAPNEVKKWICFNIVYSTEGGTNMTSVMFSEYFINISKGHGRITITSFCYHTKYESMLIYNVITF